MILTSYSFEIPGEPIAKSRPRAYMREGHIYFYNEKNVTEYQKKVKSIAYFHIKEPSLRPISMMITFYIKRPKTVKRKYPTARPDLDNYEKTILDALNGVAYKDDAQVVIVLKAKKYTEDDPHTEILLDEL